MGHGTADDMWKMINDSISRLNLAKLVQISMDEPHVNWKLHEMIQGDLKQNLELTLLNIASCNLHIVHGAFRDGLHATGWNVE